LPILILIFFLIVHPDKSFAKNSDIFKTAIGESNLVKVLSVSVKRDISLDELIKDSGFRIDDEDVFSFLKDFLSLNENISSLSSIKKGTLV
ncbi:MAG: hypothetical protein GTO02_13460, partial [Candidatus Dadabacteria bacterium]|nr:hypothetical protein [Candidatus Dadabacteria bacterium]